MAHKASDSHDIGILQVFLISNLRKWRGGYADNQIHNCIWSTPSILVDVENVGWLPTSMKESMFPSLQCGEKAEYSYAPLKGKKTNGRGRK